MPGQVSDETSENCYFGSAALQQFKYANLPACVLLCSPTVRKMRDLLAPGSYYVSVLAPHTERTSKLSSPCSIARRTYDSTL